MSKLSSHRRKTAAKKRKHRFETLERRHLLAAVTWDGGGDGTSWHDPVNWDSDSLPTKSDEVFIPSSKGDLIVEYSQTTNPIQSLTSQAGLLISGGDFSISGPASLPRLALDGGNLFGGAWTVGGLTWNAANIKGSDLEVTDTLAWDLTSSIGRTLDADASLTLANGATGNMENGRLPLIQGTVTIAGELSVAETSIGGGGAIVVASGGSFVKTATSNLRITPSFTNDGTVQVETDTLTIAKGNNKGQADDGIYLIQADATLVFSDAGFPRTLTDSSVFSGAGDLRFEGGSSQTTIASDIGNIKGDITIEAGTVTWNSSTPLPKIDLVGGNLDSDATLTIGQLNYTDGDILANDLVVSGVLNLADKSGSRRVIAGGLTLAENATGVWSGTRRLVIGVDAQLNIAGDMDNQTDADLQASTGGVLNILPAGTLRKTAGGPQLIFPATTVQGTLHVDGGQSLEFFRAVNQSGGVANIGGQLIVGGTGSNEWNVHGGKLTGLGKVTADVTNTGGIIAPNDSAPGTLTIDGDYEQGNDGTLAIQLGGAGANEFDRLVITGEASIDGTIQASLTEGFDPDIGDTFDFLTYGSIVGDFASENGFDLANNRALTRSLAETAMTFGVRDTAGDADAIRVAINDGLAQVVDSIDQWTALYAQSGLPVLPSDLEFLLDLPTIVSTLATDALTALDDPVATIDELLSVLTATPTLGGLDAEILCGQNDSPCADDGLVEAKVTLAAPTIAGEVDFNDETAALMASLAAAADIDGQIQFNADFSVEIVLGVDANGFYIGDGTQMMVLISAGGEIGASFDLVGDLGLTLTGRAGTGADAMGGEPVTATLALAEQTKLRLGEFGDGSIFVRTVDGALGVNATMNVDPFELPFGASWAFMIADGNVATSNDIQFPNQDQLLAAVLSVASSGLPEIIGDEIANLLEQIETPLGVGAPYQPFEEQLFSNDEIRDVLESRLAQKLVSILVNDVTVSQHGLVRSGTGNVATEGDFAIRANQFRLENEPDRVIDGSGVKIGVLSDGADTVRRNPLHPELTPGKVNLLPGYADSRNTGPSPKRGRDEGTVMMEIIHDIAPQAELYFAGPQGSSEYINAINEMIANGVTIIVDDIDQISRSAFDISEPELVAIKKAIDKHNVLFVSASGNNAQRSYLKSVSASDFVSVPSGFVPGMPEGHYLKFDTELGSSVLFNEMVVPAQSRGRIHLQWTDDFDSPRHDFEIFIIDSRNNAFSSASSGNLALQQFQYGNRNQIDETLRLAIRYKGDKQDNMRLDQPPAQISLVSERNNLSFIGTEGSTVHKNSVPGVLSVGAVFVGQAGDLPAASSSRGRETQLGVVAPTNVSVSLPGYGRSVNGRNRFAGTSAAAPHVAAAAALLQQRFPATKEKGGNLAIKSALENSARDVLPPLLAFNDTVVFQPSGTTSIRVLENDLDLVDALRPPGELSSPKRIVSVTPPSSGSATFSDDEIHFTPFNANATQPDQLTYTVQDRLGRTVTATVSLVPASSLNGMNLSQTVSLTTPATTVLDVLDAMQIPEGFEIKRLLPTQPGDRTDFFQRQPDSSGADRVLQFTATPGFANRNTPLQDSSETRDLAQATIVYEVENAAGVSFTTSLTLLAARPDGLLTGYDAASGSGYVHLVDAARLLESAPPDQSVQRLTHSFAAIETPVQTPDPLTWIDVLESKNGVTVESAIDNETIVQLLSGYFSDIGDLLRIRVAPTPDSEPPISAAYNFGVSELAGLDDLGLTGELAVEMAPIVSVGIGFDVNGLFVESDSTIGANVTGIAAASGELGPLAADVIGTVSQGASLSLAPADTNGDGKIRLDEVSSVNLVDVFEVDLTDFVAELSLDLSSDLLDYVDADGNIENNTVNGGDVFHLAASTSLSAAVTDDFGNIEFVWDGIRIANPDVNGDSVVDFTSEVLAENARRLALDVVRGKRSVLNDELLAGLSDLIPLGSTSIADSLQLHRTFADALLDATEIEYVIPFSDGATDDGQNNTIEDWLNGGIPTDAADIIRVSVDLASLTPQPSDLIDFDLSSLFPGGINDVQVGIENVILGGQLVLGLDTSADPLFLLTDSDDTDATTTEITAQFDVFLGFSGAPLLGLDILTFTGADARVTPRMTLNLGEYDGGKLGLLDALSGAPQFALDIQDADVMTFTATGATVASLVGPLTVIDETPNDGVPAISATIDLGEKSITGTIDRISGDLFGTESGITADDLTFAFGNNLPVDEPIISAAQAGVAYKLFGPEPVNLRAFDLEIQRDGDVTARRLQADSDTDLFEAATGLGGILPVKVTQVGIEVSPDDQGNQPDITLLDFSYTNPLGEPTPVNIDVTGYLDLSLYDDSPIQPSIQIGGNQLPTGPNNRFTFTYQYLDGQLRPYDVGPISMAIDNRIAQGIDLRGEIVLGGYEDGIWNSNLSGNLTAKLDADENQGDLVVTILPGSTLDVETGVLDVRAEITLDADISGEIGGFQFDGGVLPFQMFVDVDQVNGTFVLGEFSVEFGSLEIERLFFELNDLLIIEASGIVVDPNAAPGEAVASIGQIDVIIPSTSILAGTEVSVVGNDLELFNDRLSISSLELGLSGTLSVGTFDVLAVNGLSVNLHDVELGFGGFANLLDSETVSSPLGDSLFASTSQIDVSLSSGVLFPDRSPNGTISDTGQAAMQGLNATIQPDASGLPKIAGTIVGTQQKLFARDDLSFEAVGLSFVLGADTSEPLLKVDEAILGLKLFDDQRLDFVAYDLEVTQQGEWSITGAGLNADDGLLQTLGLAGFLPVDVVAAGFERPDDERIILYSSDGVFLGDSIDASVNFAFDYDFFEAMPFDPVLIIDGNRIDPPTDQFEQGETFEFSFNISNDDGGLPEIKIADTGELTFGIEDFALGPFSVPIATVTLGGYVDGEFQTNFGADVDIRFSDEGVEGGAAVFIDPDTSRLTLPDSTDDPALPDVTSLSVDLFVSGTFGVGSLASGNSDPGPGFLLRGVEIPLALNLEVEFSDSGVRLLPLDDKPFLKLGDNSVTADVVGVQLSDLIRMEATEVSLDFDAFEIDESGLFQATDGPFITFGGNGPSRIEPTGDEHLTTLSGGDGELTVTLGDPNDQTNALAGFGGSAGNFGIGYDPASVLGVTLVPLDGMFVSLSAPENFNFGLPEDIPIRLTELGIQLPDNLGSLMPVGGIDNLNDAGGLALDIFAGSTLNVSGGIDSVEGGWPIRALVEDMEIDLGAIAQWANLVSDPERVETLRADVRETIGDLVADGETLQAIGLIGVDLFQSVEIPPVIKNIDAVDFGIEPFDLGPLSIGGGLGFGVVDIDSDGDGQDDAAALFGRVEGQVVYDGIGLGVELIVTEYGPILGRVLAGAPIPIGTMIGSLVGSLAPGVGTAAGAAVGTASGFVISGLQGGLVFDGIPLPLINDPVEILNVPEIKQPLDVSLDDIKSSVATAIANENSTWENGFKLIGTGMLNNIYAPGVFNFRGTFGVNVGAKPSDFGLDDIPEDYRHTVDPDSLGIDAEKSFGVQFYGLSTANVMGQELAATGILLDFIDPVNPVVNLAAQLPGEGNLLSLLLPVDAEVGLRLDTQGLAEGAVVAVSSMLENIADGVSGELRVMFRDLASELNQFRDSTLTKILLDGQAPDTEITFEFLVDRLETIIGDGVDALRTASETTSQIVLDAILTASEVFRNLSGLFSASVSEIVRLKDEYFNGAADVVNALETVLGNINEGVSANAAVIGDLLRNTDYTRVVTAGNPPNQGLDATESAISIDAEYFFDRFEQLARDAKSAQQSHPWVDAALVEFLASEFLSLVREVNPAIVAENLFDSLSDNPVLHTMQDGIREQFGNVADLIDPFAQPVNFIAAKTFASAKASLERQFELATAIGTIVVDSASDGLREFFEIIDPSLTVSGAIQPVLLGIPLGEPTDSIEVLIDKKSLRFDLQTRVIEKLQLFAQQPLPLRDEIQIGVEVPFDNLFRDLALGGIPDVDPSRDWRFTFRGTVNFLSLFDLGDVAGIAFPAIDPNESLDPNDDTNGNGIPDAHPLDTHVQTVRPGTDLRTLKFEQGLFGPQPVDGESDDIRQFNKIVVLDDPGGVDDFDTLQANGGVLLDGRLTLPQFITDPFAWFAHLRGIGADLVDGCSESENGSDFNAFECFLADPQAFMDAASDVAEVAGAEHQIAQVQLFVPDFRDELSGILDIGDPAETIATIQNAIMENDPGALLGLLDQATIDALEEKIFTQTYFRGQIGRAPKGDLPTTGRLLGIDFGGATLQYADPDPSDANPNERSLLVSGTVAGVNGEFEFKGLEGGFPSFGGEFAVGTKAEGAVASPITQFEQLLRDNPIVGVNDPTLTALADWLFQSPSTENESDTFGAVLRGYTPGFNSDESAPLIQRAGGVEIEAELNIDNLLGNVHGDLQFAVAPDAGSELGITANGSFHGYGMLTLGGLVNIPLGTESDPIVQGDLTEDGLLVLDLGQNLGNASTSIGLTEDTRLQLLVNLSDQGTTWEDGTTIIVIGAGEVRLAVEGGLRFGDFELDGSFLLDISEDEILIAGSGAIDTGSFGTVFDGASGDASVIGVWQRGQVDGAFGSVVVSGGFSAGSDFFGTEATIGIGVNTTGQQRGVDFDALTDAIELPPRLQDSLTLEPESFRLFASGEIDLLGLDIGGSFALERTSSRVFVSSAVHADVLGSSVEMNGNLTLDGSGFLSVSLTGDFPQLGTDFLHIEDANARVSLDSGSLSVQIIGGELDLPIGPNIDLPSLTVNVSADDIFPRSFFLSPSEWRLDEFFGASGNALRRFEVSLTNGVLRIQRPTNLGSIPLISLPGSNLELDSFLISADLANPLNTAFQLGVSGSLGLGDLELANASYEVTLENGVLQFGTTSPTELDLGFLDVDVSGYARTDGDFAVSGDANLNVTVIGFGVNGSVSVDVDQDDLEIDFSGSITTPIGDLARGSGSITAAGCLTLGTTKVPLAPQSCGPEFSIGNVSRIEGSPSGSTGTTIFSFEVSMSRLFQSSDPGLIRVPIFLESDTSVPVSRRAKIGNDQPYSALGINYPGDDVDDDAIPSLVFSRSTTTSQRVEVTVYRDRNFEQDERFRVRLGTPVNEFGSAYGALGDSIGIGTIRNDDPNPSVRGRAANAYLENAQVFFDSDRDGVLDANEPRTLTAADGAFELAVVAEWDLNGNGSYDDEEGNLVAIGGIDSGTARPSPTVLMARGGSDFISPLTTVLVSLVDRFGLSLPDARELVANRLQIPDRVSIESTDLIVETIDGNSDAAVTEAAVVTINNTATLVATTLAISGGLNDRVASAAAYDAIAEEMLLGDVSDGLGLASVTRSILDRALDDQSIVMDDAVAEAIAGVIAESNKRIALVTVVPSLVYLQEIKRVQSAVLANTVDDLASLVSGGLGVGAFVDGNTGDALTAKIAAAVIGDIDPVQVSLSDSDVTKVSKSETIAQEFTLSLDRPSTHDVTVRYSVFDRARNVPLGEQYSVVIPAGATEKLVELTMDPSTIDVENPNYFIGILGVDGGVIADPIGLPRFDLPPQSVQLLGDPDSPDHTILFVQGTADRDLIRFGLNVEHNRIVVWTDGVNRGTFDAEAISRIRVETGAGNDFIDTVGRLPIDMHVDTGSGNDWIESGDGNDLILSGTGRDIIFSRAGDDVVFSGAGNDLIYASSGADTVHAGSGNDFVYAATGDDTVNGDEGNDWISGSSGNDTLNGGAGHDHLFGSSGDDELIGGTGNDRLFGAAGNDLLVGAEGDDEIFGSGGDDTVDGGSGNDSINLGQGNDTAVGGEGRDFIDGRNGDDTISGGSGNDYLRGGHGDDSLRGDGGNDRLDGNSGDDEIIGGDDNDDLRGGPGTNRIVPGNELTNLAPTPEGELPIVDFILPPVLLARDVNGDGQVTALDALFVINSIARTNLSPIESLTVAQDLLDVNRDNRVSALDALLIINQRAAQRDQTSDDDFAIEMLQSASHEEITYRFDQTSQLIRERTSDVTDSLDRDEDSLWGENVDAALQSLDELLI